MDSQFKSLRFASKKMLNIWLKENTSKIIHFKNDDQDLTTMHIHATGEILQCNCHGNIYIGKFVDIKRLSIGKNLRIKNELTNKWNQLIFIIESIEDNLS